MFPIFLLTICFSIDAVAQRTFSGEVTKVLSGDTFVVETQSTKFTVKLQFVDAPEPSQPLQDVVKTHLSGFIMNKQVHVDLGSLSNGVHRCRVLLNGVDLGLQMLRDGAVWYSVPDGSSQNPEEKAAYLDIEKLAKAERRGVWGVAGLKPAYELRLAREKALNEKLEAERKKWLESAQALAKFNEPAIGMSVFSFDRLCSSASGDYFSTHESAYGQTIYKSLVWTKERDGNNCSGDFDFDENLRLTSIGRSGRIK